MKTHALLQKVAIRYTFAGFAFSMLTYLAWTVGTPLYQEFNQSFAMKEFKQYGVAGTYKKHFFSFVDRIHGLAGLEQENEKLNQKVAELESKTTHEEANRTERELASLNETLELKFKAEAGSETATILESIDYEVPEHISSIGIYSLALGYFRKQDFEKSAVLLNHLLTLKNDRQFMRPENYLLCSISWYHLRNFKEASAKLDETKKHSKKSSAIYRSAALWEAIVSKAQGQDQLVQKQLLHFVELYPHSEESRMINSKRGPASHD